MKRISTNIWVHPETGDTRHVNLGDAATEAVLTAKGYQFATETPARVIDDSGKEVTPPVVINLVSPTSEDTVTHPGSTDDGLGVDDDDDDE